MIESLVHAAVILSGSIVGALFMFAVILAIAGRRRS